MVEVKICGVTTVRDAMRCVELGADAIGLNFWTGSSRHVELQRAADIVAAVRGQAQVVGVFVDATVVAVREVARRTGIDWVQLHGDEPPEVVAELLPQAFKAVAAKDGAVVELCRRYPGEHLLLDASVPGMRGGTGRTFDWAIAAEVARERKLTLAGGLTPDNVLSAIRVVRPYRVDVASGVESAPGKKDSGLVRRFIEAAKTA